MTIYTGYDKPIATYPEPNSTYPDPRETRLNLYPKAVAAFTDHKETRLYNAQGELFFSYPLLTDMDD
jgi:hypothetical protein